MLENEGFVCDRYVDIFDGGPTVTARDRPDPHVREARTATRRAKSAEGGTTMLLAQRAGCTDFRACYGAGRAAAAKKAWRSTPMPPSCSTSSSATSVLTVAR